ncbi:MAG: hypothetical protein V4444_02580 [Pseudomonadota bacterium]
MMLAALLSQALNVTEPNARPWMIFRSVCMEGATVSSQNDFLPSSSKQLPGEARHALGRNLIDAGLLASIGVNFIVSASEGLRNPVYALPGGEGFLILPTSETKKANAFSGMCAVVVRGTHYLEALHEVDSQAAAKLEKKLARSGTGIVQINEFRRKSSKYETSITEVDGWTSAAVNSNR